MWQWSPDLVKEITENTPNKYIVESDSVKILIPKIVAIEHVTLDFLKKKFTKAEAICYFNIFKSSQFLCVKRRILAIKLAHDEKCDICGLIRTGFAMYKLKCHNIFVCQCCKQDKDYRHFYISHENFSDFSDTENHLLSEKIDIAFVKEATSKTPPQIIFLYTYKYHKKKFLYTNLAFNGKWNIFGRSHTTCTCCFRYPNQYGNYCCNCRLQCYEMTGLANFLSLDSFIKNIGGNDDIFCSILSIYFSLINLPLSLNKIISIRA